METRVLTLFDDEEFFPQEPPKEKPKKEKAAKGEARPVSADEAEATDAHFQEYPETDTAPVIFEEADIPMAIIEPERLVDDKIPENESMMLQALEETTVHAETEREDPALLSDDISLIQDIEATAASLETELPEPELPEAPIQQADDNQDKELDRQILSELIQLDYTALVQKNYTFDLDSATVINKELPKQKNVVIEEKEEAVTEEEVFEEVTPLPEWNLDKKYYTIGEVAQLFSVNTSHIRFWTTEFKLKPRTTRKGDRLYSPKDIAELRLIHHLVKEKKHTIKGAREKLKVEKTGVNNKLDLKESLVQLKNTLLKIKEQL